MHEGLPAQLALQAVQNRGGGFFGRQRDALAVDKRHPAAVAVEGQPQVGPLVLHGRHQVFEQLRLRAVRRLAAEIVLGRVVNGREEGPRKDGLQIAPRPPRITAEHRIQHHAALRAHGINPRLLQPGHVVEGDFQLPA